eukprot:scaffold231637_cov18-Prasinocladus_malaysianus.AAC.1
MQIKTNTDAAISIFKFALFPLANDIHYVEEHHNDVSVLVKAAYACCGEEKIEIMIGLEVQCHSPPWCKKSPVLR